MKSSIELVQEFHEVFNHLVAETPILPNAATVLFRTNFIKEELDELADAVAENDIIGVADALGDIQYVLDGYFLNCGLHGKKDAILQAIHTSNMSKACKDQPHAEATIESLKNTGTEAYFEKVGDFYIVKRTSDDKVMKALGYSLPDLKTALGL